MKKYTYQIDTKISLIIIDDPGYYNNISKSYRTIGECHSLLVLALCDDLRKGIIKEIYTIEYKDGGFIFYEIDIEFIREFKLNQLLNDYKKIVIKIQYGGSAS